MSDGPRAIATGPAPRQVPGAPSDPTQPLDGVKKRPIQPTIESRKPAVDDGASAHREDFREALSYWASGVTIVAVRDEGDVHATTVSSLTSVSDSPPTVLVSLGRTARVLPFLEPGVQFGVSVLASNQQRLASVYADNYPVGPSPFPDEGLPTVAGALAFLECVVVEVREVGASFVVVGQVERAAPGEGDGPLIYFRRSYRALE